MAFARLSACPPVVSSDRSWVHPTPDMPGTHGGNSDFAVCGYANGNLATRAAGELAGFEPPCEIVTLQPRKMLPERKRTPGRSHYRGSLIEGQQLDVLQPISSGDASWCAALPARRAKLSRV